MNAEELMETSGVTSLLVHLKSFIAKPRTGEGSKDNFAENGLHEANHKKRFEWGAD